MQNFDGTDRKGSREIYNRVCDTTKAATILGFAPAVTVEQGIRRIATAGNIQEDWPFNP